LRKRKKEEMMKKIHLNKKLNLLIVFKKKWRLNASFRHTSVTKSENILRRCLLKMKLTKKRQKKKRTVNV